ncbi:hypothetical protein GCM10010319_01610 [Streptomyces blastmyceticus]|uniref:Uncharacterized protein n=1 Tax=Streptomyces blastmyceticus TaxID=68180 RepID=A0ABN0W8S6_9ACTN
MTEGEILPNPAPPRNRGSAPDPGPQTPDGLSSLATVRETQPVRRLRTPAERVSSHRAAVVRRPRQ